ncbi:hypothetical protein N9917_03465 [Deltaproteobacteria bacterium]|nr:hypothetical protein [Deltaproteobacteria bacterium]
MALGKLKKVGNINPKLNSSEAYWFIKAQSESGGEEYWLVTARERKRFKDRAAKNPEDQTQDLRRGRFFIVANDAPKPNAKDSYYSLVVHTEDGPEAWMLSDYDLERLRVRTERNAEDIEANKEGWLADLLD